LFVEMLNYHYM